MRKKDRRRSMTSKARKRQIQVRVAKVAERARKTKSEPLPRLLFESTVEYKRSQSRARQVDLVGVVLTAEVAITETENDEREAYEQRKVKVSVSVRGEERRERRGNVQPRQDPAPIRP